MQSGIEDSDSIGESSSIRSWKAQRWPSVPQLIGIDYCSLFFRPSGVKLGYLCLLQLCCWREPSTAISSLSISSCRGLYTLWYTAWRLYSPLSFIYLGSFWSEYMQEGCRSSARVHDFVSHKRHLFGALFRCEWSGLDKDKLNLQHLQGSHIILRPPRPSVARPTISIPRYSVP